MATMRKPRLTRKGVIVLALVVIAAAAVLLFALLVGGLAVVLTGRAEAAGIFWTVLQVVLFVTGLILLVVLGRRFPFSMVPALVFVLFLGAMFWVVTYHTD